MSADCQQEWRNQFHVYDQAVDVISCWEGFMSYLYSNIFNHYHFERFPSIPQDDNKNPLTPDFTVYFNDEYGIVGEVKRTFPENDVAFNSTLNQLVKYDRDCTLKTGNDNRDTPATTDIVLLISGSSAPQIGTRINEKVNENNLLSFDENLVMLRYQYNTDATMSRYEFQRVTQYPDEFRDGALPSDISLNNNVGEGGSYRTLEVYPKHFTPIKAKKPLCNDSPPEPYLATIFWHKIFPNYLNKEDHRQWRDGSAQKSIEVSDTSDGFLGSLNDFMHEGQGNKQWVVDTLDYLRDAKLAEKDGGEYKIYFRDLVHDVGEREIQKGTEMLQKSKELAYMFIKRYCEYTKDKGADEEAEAQSSLDQYT